MASFEHDRLIESLAAAERAPVDPTEFSLWIRGVKHLGVLQKDIEGDELILAVLSPIQTCLNSYVVPSELPALGEDLLALTNWSPNPLHHNAATYSWSWGSQGIHAIHRDDDTWRSLDDLPVGVSPLVFFRDVEGHRSVSHDVAQDFVHATGIHWRRERRAFSRIDFRGDWEDVISQSTRQASAQSDLISVRRNDLDLHLLALNAVVVRVFDFVLRSPSLPSFFDFSDHVKRIVRDDSALQYHELLNEGNFGIIRGVQIVRPRLNAEQAEQLVKHGRIPESTESEPIEFRVQDIRNGGITTVSTDPTTTTNYFEARGNDLPFETSPAYFRPEVLAKYKADQEKYTVSEDRIECRGGWLVKHYSSNAAGQLAVYICDLRHLPHEEQRYWQTFNEAPKAGLSARAIQTDFLGEWPDEMTPRERLIEVLERWRNEGVRWWTWRMEGSPSDLVVPRMESRDEWFDAVLWLSNAIVEGFSVKELRCTLTHENVTFDRDWKSIKLLEQVLPTRGIPLPGGRLSTLREINEIRVYSGLHATAGRSEEVAIQRVEQHGSFVQHFEFLCDEVAKELSLIETVLTP